MVWPFYPVRREAPAWPLAICLEKAGYLVDLVLVVIGDRAGDRASDSADCSAAFRVTVAGVVADCSASRAAEGGSAES